MLEPSTRTLAGIALFESLEADERGRLEAACRWRQYAAGDSILESGSESRDVFFVLQGAANIVNFSPTLREVAYATVRAGDYFGELAAIDREPRSASVIAVEDALVAIMPANVFVELLQRRADVTFRVLQHLTQMVRAGDARILELSTLAATQRVYAELLRMAAPEAAVPGLWVIRPLPPLRDIASRVSTTRETAVRALSQLYAADLIRRKGRNLYIMDRARLAEALKTLQGHGGPRGSGDDRRR